MDEAQNALVKQALERRTGKTIITQTRVDPSILGGVIARVGDQVIDGSVRYRLIALQRQLLTDVSSADIDFFSEELTKAGSDGQTTEPDTTRPAYRSQAQV